MAQPGTRLFISNCAYTDGQITATSTAGTTGVSAFIVGYAGKKATIESCYSQASFSNDDDYDTGMAFAHGENTVIEKCYQYILSGEVSTNPNYMQNGVGKYTRDDAKRGILAYKLNGETNDPSKGIRWEHEIYNGETLPHVAVIGDECKGVYYTRNITNSLGTIVLPYDAVSNDDVTYYTLAGANADGTIGFESVDVLPAGTPAVFATPIIGTLTFTGCANDNFGYTNHDVQQGNWTMKGNLRDPYNDLFFVKENGDDMSRLYYISGGQSIAIRLDDGDATLISWAEEDDAPFLEQTVGETPAYNLQGQQVGDGYKGIVILNGKKYIKR